MKSYKTKTKTRSRNKIKLSSKNKNWDVLVHASNNPYALFSIAEDKMLKVYEGQIDNWLLDKKTKNNFGDYFNYGNNRYNVIKLVTENIDRLNLLKYEKHKKKMLYNIESSDYDTDFLYTPGVYTTYIFSNLNYNVEYPFYGFMPPILFVISSKILKEKPFIVCESMMYGHCVNKDNTFKKGFYGKGNLKIKPSMKELQHFLNKKIPEDTYYNSHEIIFDNIPLKYINAIFYYHKFNSYEQLRKLFPQKHIHIVKLPTKQFINKDNKLVEIPDYKNYKQFLQPYSY